MSNKTIDRDTYLKVLGLFTLASGYQRKCDEAEIAMNDLLGLENGSRVSDEIYSPRGGFDKALEYAGITVSDEPKT